MKRAVCLTVGLLVLLGGARSARATPNFPDELSTQWGVSSLPTSPACLLCHTNPAGGLGTVTTPFGSFLRSRGLRAYDVASLRTALEADRAERHDSDGNGLPDYDDLQKGDDPNGAAGDGDVERPRYGCAVNAPHAGASGLGPGSLVCALVALVVLRRSRSVRLRLLVRARCRPRRSPRAGRCGPAHSMTWIAPVMLAWMPHTKPKVPPARKVTLPVSATLSKRFGVCSAAVQHRPAAAAVLAAAAIAGPSAITAAAACAGVAPRGGGAARAGGDREERQEGSKHPRRIPGECAFDGGGDAPT